MGTTAEDSLNPETISGGHLVAKALRNEGVDTIFTLSGGNIVDIYDGCVSEGIRIIDFRHEQVAAHAADGYARQTGQTGCLVTTAGPGCCNAVIGLATALRSETPLLHIGGQGATTQYLQGSLQEYDHVKLMSPVTKWASSVKTTERMADMVSMACPVRRLVKCPGRFILKCRVTSLIKTLSSKTALFLLLGITAVLPKSCAFRKKSKSWLICSFMPKNRRYFSGVRSGTAAVIPRQQN